MNTLISSIPIVTLLVVALVFTKVKGHAKKAENFAKIAFIYAAAAQILQARASDAGLTALVITCMTGLVLTYVHSTSMTSDDTHVNAAFTVTFIFMAFFSPFLIFLATVGDIPTHATILIGLFFAFALIALKMILDF